MAAAIAEEAHLGALVAVRVVAVEAAGAGAVAQEEAAEHQAPGNSVLTSR